MTTTLAVRYDYATSLVADAERRRRVAEILMRPAFASLERVSADRGGRWFDHALKSTEAIAAIVADTRNLALALDTDRGKKLTASAQIKTGTREANSGALPFYGYIAIPAPTSADLPTTIAALLDLADELDAGAGFIAAEPTYDAAQKAALGGFNPPLRPGLSTRQAIERRGRDWHAKQCHAELAGPEWGTFLGAAHLARIDLDQVRASGAFHRVELVSPQLAYLQVTDDPADDLRGDFEEQLQTARAALSPVLMDLNDVTLD